LAIKDVATLGNCGDSILLDIRRLGADRFLAVRVEGRANLHLDGLHPFLAQRRL